MGERSQFYVRTKLKDGEHITAIHDQWVWGYNFVRHAARLTDILIKTSLDEYMRPGEVDDYIRSILVVREASDGMYHHHNVSIEGMDYGPDRADSNHGCVIIDVRGEPKVSFFDAEGKYVSKEDFLNNDDKQWRKLTGSKLLNAKYFDKLTEEDYKNLCKDMADLYTNNVVEAI